MNHALTLPSIGDVVDGKFRIERMLGEGGTSTVYAVRHAVTDKQFAIKWLSPELAKNELAVERFIHEAKVCGRYAHPNAVQIYDICRIDESFYLLMELLEGESLEARLKRVKRLSVQEACDILLPCTDALEAAHRMGIVHRDLKPSNIFLCSVEDRGAGCIVPKVLDFGISKLSFNGHDLSPVTTTTRTVIGTPQYMAPEQMRGHPADPRFDVYALGVVLYELVSGQPPYECDTFADLVFKVLEAQSARLDQIAHADPEFAELVARAMSLDADKRHANMVEFARALLPFSSHRKQAAPHQASPRATPAQASPPMAAEAAPRTLKIDPQIAGRAAAAVLARAEPKPVPVPAAEDADTPSEVTAFGVATSDSEDTPTHAFRTRRGRSIAVAVTVAAALGLAWQLRAVQSVTSSAAAPAILQPRPRAIEPAPSQDRAADSGVPLGHTSEPTASAQPSKLQPAKSAKPDGAKSAAARRSLRSRATKPAAAAPHERNERHERNESHDTDGATPRVEPALSSKAQLDRSDFDEPRPQRPGHGPSLPAPATGLSRQDF